MFSVVYRVIGAVEKPIIVLFFFILLMMPAGGSFGNDPHQESIDNKPIKAHVTDDQIETVMMRILRGTGVRGLVGIPARRGKIIRPILGLSREQTAAYCRRNHIAYVEDPSNRDRRFTRNWIRHEVLPVIEKNFPSVGENLLRLRVTPQPL